jgi:hypothetical protein
MDGLNERALAQPTRDLDQAKSDLDRVGYCLLADALDAGRLAPVRGRLYEQVLAEKQAGTAYFDGAPLADFIDLAAPIAGEMRPGRPAR